MKLYQYQPFNTAQDLEFFRFIYSVIIEDENGKIYKKRYYYQGLKKEEILEELQKKHPNKKYKIRIEH